MELLQTVLPQYEVTGFIARGGMGAVYRAVQRTLKRPVAIKVLPPGADRGDLQFSERFVHEAQAMALLSHPNIVAVYEAGEVELEDDEAWGTAHGADGTAPDDDDGEGGTLLYFVMEYIEGTDLAAMLAHQQRLEPEHAVPVISAVCDALAFAHEEGIIHRDIKPSNVMIDHRGRVKVADFGLAKSLRADSTLVTYSDLRVGTPDFVAPEAQVAGQELDQRADLYAVGVMLYQMLTGRLPRGRFEPPSRLVPGLDARFDAIVDRALQADRTLRYATAAELKQAVESVLAPAAGNGSAAGQSSPALAAVVREAGGKGRPVISRVRHLMWGSAAAAIALSAGVYWLGRRHGESLALPPPAEASKTLTAGSGGIQRWPAAEPAPMVNGAYQLTPVKWMRVFGKPEELPQSLRSAGAEVVDGWIDGSNMNWMAEGYIRRTWSKNQGIRLRCQLAAESKPELASKRHAPLVIALAVRCQMSEGTTERKHSSAYKFSIRQDPTGEDRPFVAILTHHSDETVRGDDFQWVDPGLPDRAGTEFDLALFAIGDRIIARVNGQTLIDVRDTRLAEGEMKFQSPHRVRDVDVINLDGLTEEQALGVAGIASSAARADAAWMARWSKPGRLRAVGVDEAGAPIDLSAAEPYADFVLVSNLAHTRSSVDGRPRQWIALRANGDVVASDGAIERGCVGITGSTRILAGGTVVSYQAPPPPEPVLAFAASACRLLPEQPVVSAWQSAADGTWHIRSPAYESGALERPDLTTPPAVRTVVVSSVGTGVIREDGTLRIWGVKELRLPETVTTGVRDALNLGYQWAVHKNDKDVLRLRLMDADGTSLATPEAGTYVKGAEALAAAGFSLMYQRQGGRWACTFNVSPEFTAALDRLDGTSNGHFSASSNQSMRSLLWIEPASR